jgi:hypothetical protein
MPSNPSGCARPPTGSLAGQRIDLWQKLLHELGAHDIPTVGGLLKIAGIWGACGLPKAGDRPSLMICAVSGKPLIVKGQLYQRARFDCIL